MDKNYKPSAEELQSRVRKQRIVSLKELSDLCEGRFDPYEDILEPIGYNTCERCGGIDDSTWLYWLDYREWEEDNPKDQALLKGLAKEKADYCAICWECVKELTKKGEQL